jgi:RNA polymerase sigma-70 factor (ECF subfamily)
LAGRGLFFPGKLAPTANPIGFMQPDGHFATKMVREDPLMPVRPAPDPMPAPDLESLMSGYQQADEEAARALIERVSPVLLRFFWVQFANRRFADDLLQETWMRVHKARHTYRPGEPALPWIIAIARYTGIDNYRKSRRVEASETQVDVLPEPVSPNPSFAQPGPDIEAILGALPESQREVIVMLKVTGMTIEEVARATSSSAGSVKQKAHRAYRKLREVLLSGRRST